MGEQVEYPGGGGYLATGEGAGPGVLVVPDTGADAAHAAAVCDRLAAEGFTALAPGLGPEGAAHALPGAVDHLQGHPAVRGRGVGVIGFGTGGGLALWLAATRPDRVAAVVPFYAVVPSGGLDYGAVTAAVEAHDADEANGAGGATRRLEATLGELGRDVRVFVYPGTSTAFFDDTRPDAYDEDASRQAWVRTLEFLRAKLG